MQYRFFFLFLSFFVTLWPATPSSAQTNPASSFAQSTITIVVPYPAGGSVDMTARLLAAEFTKRWKGTVVVENRSGAAAVIGTQYVARANPDGRTILLATAGMSIQPAAYTLPYDVFDSFVPVTQIVTSPSLLTASPSIPVKNTAELIEYLKTHPSTPFGSQGIGSHSHLLMEIFQSEAGLKMTNIPYRGSAPATQALLAGETKLHFDIMSSMLPYIAENKATPIIVTTPTRQKQLPNVPTAREAGFSTLEAASSWSGFFVPAGTEKAVVDEIYRATKEALTNPVVVEKLMNAGYILVGSPPEQFRDFFHQDVARYKKAAENAGITKETPK
jgi:tripartite-type tricarboxylate transporter receptor subunit TctC